MPEAGMPLSDAERRFVGTFIRAERRERLLYELANPKKRYRGLSRFCHQAGELLEPARIRVQGRCAAQWDALARFAAAQDTEVRILSLDPWLDGLVLPFPEAVGRLKGAMDAAILLGDGFAAVCGEPEKAGTQLWLLTEEKNADFPQKTSCNRERDVL